MENKENDTMDLYNKGKSILENIDKYSEISSTSEGEESNKAKEKILSLNDEKNKLKDEIYSKAKEKSGLDYSKEDKNPELLRKKYNEQIAELKSRKHNLKLEKIRLEKLSEEKKVQINEQFDIACQKYKMMLDMGKITKELYEARIQNMKAAKLNDILDLSNSLYKIKEETDKTDLEMRDVKEKLSDLEQNERIYNEYGDVYYRLFGEVLADRNKMDITVKGKEDESDKVDNKNNVDDKKENNIKEENNYVTENNQSQPQNEVSTEAVEPEIEEKSKVLVTSKSMFQELYKKMKKGTITDNELNALVQTLENPDNYDKYGISTGIIFNKARKILKYQGARTAANIENFLRGNNAFSDEIKFDTSIEKDNVLSHDILKSWKDIDEKLTYTDAELSVEKYINRIEKYKKDGNELTKEQENIFKEAMEIKNNLASYRKAINTTDEVATERDSKDRNSIFYLAFKNKFKNESRRALPETDSDRDNPGFIVINRPLDLSSMVNNEPTSEDLENNKKERSKEKNRDVVK